MTIRIWIRQFFSKVRKLEIDAGPRRISSRPTKNSEAMYNSVRARNNPYSTARSCLHFRGAVLASRPATAAANRLRSPDSPTRSEKRLPSPVNVPGWSLAKRQTMSRPFTTARNDAAASNRLLRSMSASLEELGSGLRGFATSRWTAARETDSRAPEAGGGSSDADTAMGSPRGFGSSVEGQ